MSEELTEEQLAKIGTEIDALEEKVDVLVDDSGGLVGRLDKSVKELEVEAEEKEGNEEV